MTMTTSYARFTLDDFDRHEITQIQQEAPQLSPKQAQLLHEYRHKSHGITALQPHELRFCEALEDQLARSKAEAAIPLRRDNGRGPSSFRAPAPSSPAPEQDNTDERLKMLDMALWDDVEVPPRDWAVKDRIIRRAVTLLSGEGGVGKSILSLQLACAHVLARDWFGSLPEPGPAFYLNAEDDERELHYRLNDIRAHLGVTFTALKDGGLHLVPLAGEDALLGVPDRAGIVQPTPLFERLLRAATNIKPVLIVLDTAADMFGGNENDRSEVRQFVGLLRRLAITSNSAVLLASHPSLTGIATDSGLSGSTAWNNSVRSRLFFKAADSDDDARSDQRELIVRKNNYGPSGETIRMIWRNGLFVPVTAPSSIERAVAEQKVEDLFMGLLARFSHEGRKVSDKTGTNYAPAKFAAEPETKTVKCSKQALADAMRRLFTADKIRVQEDGPPSHRRSRLVIVGGVEDKLAPYKVAKFQIIGPADQPCEQCSDSGDVYLIRDSFKGVASHALHERCASAFYKREE